MMPSILPAPSRRQSTSFSPPMIACSASPHATQRNAGPRGESIGVALGGNIAMNPQAMTLEQIREQGLAILRQHLGIVGMVRFLQQSEMGWGNYTEERYQWLGEPDLEELAKKIQTHYPDRENLT